MCCMADPSVLASALSDENTQSVEMINLRMYYQKHAVWTRTISHFDEQPVYFNWVTVAHVFFTSRPKLKS